jgi:hypothetical protein
MEGMTPSLSPSSWQGMMQMPAGSPKMDTFFANERIALDRSLRNIRDRIDTFSEHPPKPPLAEPIEDWIQRCVESFAAAMVDFIGAFSRTQDLEQHWRSEVSRDHQPYDAATDAAIRADYASLVQMIPRLRERMAFLARHGRDASHNEPMLANIGQAVQDLLGKWARPHLARHPGLRRTRVPAEHVESFRCLLAELDASR